VESGALADAVGVVSHVLPKPQAAKRFRRDTTVGVGETSVNSSIMAMPTVVALRPVSSEALVVSTVRWCGTATAAHRARRCASSSASRPSRETVQVAMPVSSHTRYRMLGAPSGAVGAANGPNPVPNPDIQFDLAVELGRHRWPHSRSGPRDFGCRLHRPAELPANSALTNDHAVAETNSPTSRIRRTRDDWAPARLLAAPFGTFGLVGPASRWCCSHACWPSR